MSNTQDLGDYIPQVRASGIRINRATEPLVVGPNSTASFAGPLTTTQAIKASAAVALAATGGDALDPTKSSLFTLTPTASETITASSAPIGARVSIVVTTSGSSSFTVTFGTNFKTTGTLATGTVTGKVFTVTFVGDGTNMNEVSRTTAM